MRRALIVSCFIGLLLITPTAASPVAPSTDLVTPVADVGGVMRATTVADGYAYLGEGHQVTILDLSTPQEPAQVAQIPLTAPITAITIHESMAYIIAWDHLVTVDVRTPTQPRIVDNVPMAVHTPEIHTYVVGNQIIIHDGLAYIAGCYYFLVMDIRQPHTPTVIGVLPLAEHYLADLAWYQGHIYAAFYDPALNDDVLPGGLYVIDVQTPTAPTIQHVEAFDVETFAVDIVDHFVYVATDGGSDAVLVYDLQTPTAPRRYQQLTAKLPAALHVTDQRAVLSGFPGVHLAHRAPDGTLAVHTTVDVPYTPTQLQLAGDWVYASNARRFDLINIQDPTAPRIAHTLQRPGSNKALAVQGTTLYTTGNGLHLIDVTNLHQPQLQGTYHPDLAIDAFVVTDTTAYLATSQGLEVVDIRHPTRPTQLTQVPWEHSINRMIQQPTGLAVGYRATYPAGGVLLVDLSNPRMPQLVGNVPLPGQVWSMAGTDRYLYTLTWHPTERTQLVIIDQQATPPQVVTTLPVADHVETLAIQEPYLYLGGDTLEVRDLATPTNPTPVTSIPLGGNLVRLIPTEHGLYGSLWDLGIVQIPLVDGRPQRPIMLTTLREVGEHLAVSEHGMFVGQWMAGVQIYQRSTVTDTVYLPLLQR